MKKLSFLVVAIVTATLLFNQPFAKAQNQEEQMDTTNFMKLSGVITNIEKTDDVITATVQSEEEEPVITVLKVNNNTLLFNSGTTKSLEKEVLKKGQKIEAYYDKNKPMIMIYPAQITPEIVILQDSEKLGFVKVSKFDGEFVSLDNNLKLNIAEDTVLENEKGDKMEKVELAGKELIVFYTNTTRSIPAQTTPSKIVAIGNEEIDATNYMKASGIIKDVVLQDGKATLTVESEEKESLTTIFIISDDTLLFNSGTAQVISKEDFKKGQRIDAYYDKNKPMILIYPARITPELVILSDEEKIGTVKVSKFDENFLSLDKELKLNIGDKTILVNEKDEKIEQEDLYGKELVVFYTIATMSIPAQTPPTKIVAITYLSPEMKEVQKIIEKDHFMQNGTKMIPLRKVAEQLGYEVATISIFNSEFIRLGNSTFVITRGEKTYSYNRSIQQFIEKPVLKDGKTYVSEDILDLLSQP